MDGHSLLIIGFSIVLTAAIHPAVMWTLSRLAWKAVADAYPAAATTPAPATSTGYGVFNGWLGYKGCLVIGADDAGLHVRNWPLLSAFHAPFFVPWSEIAGARPRKIFWADYVEVTFRKTPGITFSIRGGTYEALRPAFTKAGLLPAVPQL